MGPISAMPDPPDAEDRRPLAFFRQLPPQAQKQLFGIMFSNFRYRLQTADEAQEAVSLALHWLTVFSRPLIRGPRCADRRPINNKAAWDDEVVSTLAGLFSGKKSKTSTWIINRIVSVRRRADSPTTKSASETLASVDELQQAPINTSAHSIDAERVLIARSEIRGILKTARFNRADNAHIYTLLTFLYTRTIGGLDNFLKGTASFAQDDLLEELITTYPNQGWTKALLETSIAKLRRAVAPALQELNTSVIRSES